MNHLAWFLDAFLPGYRTPSLWVIETEDNQYLGTIEATSERTFLVRSGFTGRPSTVDFDDITAIRPAAPPEVK